MRRRSFISSCTMASAGFLLRGRIPAKGINGIQAGKENAVSLYELFKNPGSLYHPFVRWWWNGNKIEAAELVRELRLLKKAGIGGVEINPIEFPSRFEGDDLGKRPVKWLSEEWTDLLDIVFREAKSLGMTCDLIVGSGWPFGAEYLEGEERSQIVVLSVKKITGPVYYEISEFEIFREADPAVSSPFPGRKMELLSLSLVPDPVSSISQVRDIINSGQNGNFKIAVPEGKHALYGLVKISGFMQVINGAPGATGPVLNHYDANAVSKYLERMSSGIERKTGPLADNLRALFTDSMELEGSNWSAGIMEEFKRRKGYDIFPYLPFVLFKTGGMGNITDLKYGADLSPGFNRIICRMRYDFETFKSDLLEENFIKTFCDWCKKLNVKSRAQAYGRDFYPLESSFHFDIPECESWTMNWLKHKVGEEMPEDDYRRGRAYTMINKYVSSAANLTGKRLVSCEEMTDTYTVFNTSLENLKTGGDQSAITGVTHSVFHGFNYSPPEAPYPGWIRYGAYYNENNTWWPHFHLYNEYKARMSAVLQNSVMFADIAILPPNDDMWSLIGSQMEPFPNITHVDWFTLVWEAMNKNGNGCDYVSQRVIAGSTVKKGRLIFGPSSYHSIFLVNVESISVESAEKLEEFAASGGRVFCIETVPSKSTGWKDSIERDAKVKEYISRIKNMKDRCIYLQKPQKDFISWYGRVQEQYGLKPYVKIVKPDPYVMQLRRTADDGSEILFLINSHIHVSRKTRLTFARELTKNKYCWLWDPETGSRYMIFPDRENSIDLDMGPASSYLFVFCTEKNGEKWKPFPVQDPGGEIIQSGWSAEFRHCRNGSVKTLELNELRDLKDLSDVVSFAGTVIYRNTINASDKGKVILNLGKVYGTSELKVNGRSCGVKWYGRRIFDISDLVRTGKNDIEVEVTTSMGNYMKSLTDNPIAQYWTNEKNKVQPLQSMGLIGPVTIYQVEDRKDEGARGRKGEGEINAK
ncbi:MAG TPA: glycosyl hydrolase [Bacteroidales bacterium]|nr:glycosyl hydrolase [Bacteroidales bacterium]HPR12324.1 glycosyl hydrolase [Bacteroidales bacterium]